MLHQQDNNLLMLNPHTKNSIYKVDLNRTDVVEEWVHPSFQILISVAGSYKQIEHSGGVPYTTNSWRTEILSNGNDTYLCWTSSTRHVQDRSTVAQIQAS